MKIIIDISEEVFECCLPYKDNIVISNNCNYLPEMTYSIANGIPLPKSHGRKFEEIVVEYPSAELCTYPEYKGKPYFSIKYEENGEHIIGFGTYSQEVLSEYIREYFIKPIIIEADIESKEE